MWSNKITGRYYSKKIIISAFILMFIMLGVLRHIVPRDFSKIVNIEEQNSIYSMYAYRNLKDIKVQSDRIPEVLDLFKGYKYRRCIDTTMGGNVVRFQLLTNSPRWSINIEVWSNGYIRIPNNEIYKILSDDEAELFNKISKLLE